MAERWYGYRLENARKEESNDREVREVELMGKWGLTKRTKGEKNGRKRCRVGGRERGEGTRGKAGCARHARISPLKTAPGTLIPFNRTPAPKDRIPLQPPFLFTARCTEHSNSASSYACVYPS